jgi:hypothetical protein
MDFNLGNSYSFGWVGVKNFSEEVLEVFITFQRRDVEI